MYDLFLRKLKTIIGLVGFFYFAAPILFRFLIGKTDPGKVPTIVERFFALGIFHPIMEQYDIALHKNSAMYWLAFYVTLTLIYMGSCVLVFFVLKMIYLLYKKVTGKV